MAMLLLIRSTLQEENNIQWEFNNNDDNDDNVRFTFLFVSNVAHTFASRTLLASTE
jgi:hypothetical protein